MKPYKNLNGDSVNQINRDYERVIDALKEAIDALCQAQSLYHGRNAFDNHHAAALRDQHTKNLSALGQIREQYERDWEELDEPFTYQHFSWKSGGNAPHKQTTNC
jgi:hypothetical protein